MAQGNSLLFHVEAVISAETKYRQGVIDESVSDNGFRSLRRK